MRKVLVIGSGGAGKSTFARRLGSLLDIEVVHLDKLYWNPGWVETPRPAWRETIEKLLRRDAWILDGNYSNTLELRIAACDTIIFLDFPRVLCLWRVVRRAKMYRRRSRPDMAEGCEERLTLAFLLWVWNYPTASKPKILERLDRHASDKRIIRLRSQSEIERFLAHPHDA